MSTKPILGILLGDSAGIGPELVAVTAATGFLGEHCRPIIIGDSRVFAHALKEKGMDVPHYSIDRVSDADWEKGIPILDQKDQDPANIQMGVLSADCGRAVNHMLELACGLVKSGEIEGFAFAPFNKAGMKLGGCKHESEHEVMVDLLNVTGPSGEINVVGNLMTTRTTSHIPMKEVSDHLTVDVVLQAIVLAHTTARSTGIERPRVGVSALNPHGGESGTCGREEIDVIAPAVKKAAEQGINVTGPHSADVLFIKAFDGEFDSVVTMYHDQGQIALKLKGFEQGVTVAGGVGYPVATCAHGTAFDIAGKGIASPSAFEHAVRLVAKMALSARQEKNSVTG